MNTETKIKRFVRGLVSVTALKRYHMQPTLKEDNLASHSYRVSMFCYLLAGGNPSGNLMSAALLHDVGEVAIGDVGSHVKRGLPDRFRDSLKKMEGDYITEHLGLEQPELTEEEERVISLADKFDGMLFCIMEKNMGNKYLAEVFNNYKMYLIQMNLSNGWEMNIFRELCDSWMSEEI